MIAGPRLLAGRRVLVTRAVHQIGKLSQELREAGAIPVEVPVLEIQPPESLEELDAALLRLSTYDWLILTSANTVRALTDRATQLGLPFVQPDSLKVATVGEGTAKAAAGAGLKVSFVPGSYIAEGLVSGLQGHAPGARILLARAAVARDVIPDAMRAAGALVEVVDAYRNGIPVRAPGELKRALADGLDAAMFSSSSSVTHLKAAAVAGGLMWPFAGVAAISIGPITSSTLREEGWEPAAEAQVSDIPGLVKAICQYFAPMSAGN